MCIDIQIDTNMNMMKEQFGSGSKQNTDEKQEMLQDVTDSEQEEEQEEEQQYQQQQSDEEEEQKNQ